MSRDNLGSKQTFVLHNYLIKNDRHDLVITLHRQTKKILGKKTRKKTTATKPKLIIKKRFSKQRNAVSDSETNTIQELQDSKDTLNMNNSIKDQIYFSESEATTLSSILGKHKIEK